MPTTPTASVAASSNGPSPPTGPATDKSAAKIADELAAAKAATAAMAEKLTAANAANAQAMDVDSHYDAMRDQLLADLERNRNSTKTPKQRSKQWSKKANSNSSRRNGPRATHMQKVKKPRQHANKKPDSQKTKDRVHKRLRTYPKKQKDHRIWFSRKPQKHEGAAKNCTGDGDGEPAKQGAQPQHASALYRPILLHVVYSL